MVILPSLPPVQLTESTDMIKGHCEKHCTETKNITKNQLALKASERMHALQRIGKPKNISNMIRFLIDPENDWITGQNFIVDGGLSSTK